MVAESSTRRYTDQEVALVLRRAAELEDRRESPVASGRGLTLEDIRQIASEAGFSADAVNEAVAELHAGSRPGSTWWLGPVSSTKVVRAVPRRLTEGELQRLIQMVEDRAAATGTVSEALGSVRWTSVPSGLRGHHTIQVSFTPSDGETHIQVTQRHAARIRLLSHLVPGVWGGMIGLGVTASLGLVTAPALAVVGSAAVVGTAIGRGLWQAVARRRHRHVHALARDLVDEAARMLRLPSTPTD